jgi:hypothetical protein
MSAMPSAPAMPAVLAVPAVSAVPTVPVLGSPFGYLSLRSRSSGPALHSKGHELPERLVALMHGPA